jgi:hypothetical protein
VARLGERPRGAKNGRNGEPHGRRGYGDPKGRSFWSESFPDGHSAERVRLPAEEIDIDDAVLEATVFAGVQHGFLRLLPIAGPRPVWTEDCPVRG